MCKPRAGNEKTGASGAGGEEANPLTESRGRDAERREVAKHGEQVPGKAAIEIQLPVP